MKENKIKCSRVIANASGFEQPIVIYGIVTDDETNDFVIVKTRRRKYSIHRKTVISICETDRVFEGGEKNDL